MKNKIIIFGHWDYEKQRSVTENGEHKSKQEITTHISMQEHSGLNLNLAGENC